MSKTNKILSVILIGAFAVLSLLLAEVFHFNVAIARIYSEAAVTAVLVVWNVAVSGCFFILARDRKDKLAA